MDGPFKSKWPAKSVKFRTSAVVPAVRPILAFKSSVIGIVSTLPLISELLLSTCLIAIFLVSKACDTLSGLALFYVTGAIFVEAVFVDTVCVDTAPEETNSIFNGSLR